MAAVIVDDDAITATGYAIADNRTAELALWDDKALGQLLSELNAEGSLEPFGWSTEDLARLIPDEVDVDFEPGLLEDQGALDEVAPMWCPHCGENVRDAPPSPVKPRGPA